MGVGILRARKPATYDRWKSNVPSPYGESGAGKAQCRFVDGRLQRLDQAESSGRTEKSEGIERFRADRVKAAVGAGRLKPSVEFLQWERSERERFSVNHRVLIARQKNFFWIVGPRFYSKAKSVDNDKQCSANSAER